MNRSTKIAPKQEQEICIICGFCCDGTIYPKATVVPGEKANLPEKMKENYYTEKENEYFRLPCPYFDTLCTIYDKEKAYVCSAYRCQLLKDFANKKISKIEAMNIIKRAKKMRREVFFDFNTLKKGNDEIPFNQIFKEHSKINPSSAKNVKQSKVYDLFFARFNIFKALLTKHFRSTKEFESMMSDNNSNN